MRKEIRIRSARNTAIPVTVFETKGKGGLVLMAHSFKSDRFEDGRFTELGEILAETGFYSIMCDFPGSGESQEELISLSLTNACDDLQSCYEYMCSNYEIDENKLCLLGYSLGGRIISLFSEKHPEFKDLIFWAACNRNYSINDSFIDQSFEELLKQCEAKGYCRFHDIYKNEDDLLSPKFIKELLELDALKALETFAGRALIIQGGKDQTIEPENAKWIYDHLVNAKERNIHWMEEADHGFGIFDGRASDSAEIVSITSGFLSSNNG
ncbi:MAG: alpha/beta hydrolase [Erysipelotrichaceae bacterium]|nr:alpha/beta hydrolase [Erysipelotrichaceae bacterium]